MRFFVTFAAFFFMGYGLARMIRGKEWRRYIVAAVLIAGVYAVLYIP